MKVLLAALLGLVAGAIGGFVASVIALLAKRFRNDRLAARGEPGIRDVGLWREPIILVAILSAIISAVLALFFPLESALLFGAGIPSGLLLSLWIGNAIWQLRR